MALEVRPSEMRPDAREVWIDVSASPDTSVCPTQVHHLSHELVSPRLSPLLPTKGKFAARSCQPPFHGFASPTPITAADAANLTTLAISPFVDDKLGEIGRRT